MNGQEMREVQTELLKADDSNLWPINGRFNVTEWAIEMSCSISQSCDQREELQCEAHGARTELYAASETIEEYSEDQMLLVLEGRDLQDDLVGKNEQTEALEFDVKALELDVASLQKIIENIASETPQRTINVGTDTEVIKEVDVACYVNIASDVVPSANARRRSNTPSIIPVDTPPPSRGHGGARGRPAERCKNLHQFNT